MSEQVIFLEHAESFDDFITFWENVKQRIGKARIDSLKIVIKTTVPATSSLLILLKEIEGLCTKQEIKFTFVWENHESEQFLRRLESYRKNEISPKQIQSRSFLLHVVEEIGLVSTSQLKEIKDFITFTGKFSLCCFKCIFSPGKFRLGEMLYNLERVGTRAMVIVGTMSILVGLVTAFQASVQLRQFGANIFVADLVALAMVRELGPLITAILMAGRTTSAFTAEIGTMKINEELDSLKTINVDPFYFLILPKTISSIIAGPLLTAWSVFMGLLGGIIVGYMALEVTPSSFLQEVQGILTISDLWVGFLKSLIFSFIVGTVGCFMGLETGHDADSVGQQTTKAVVRALFSIVVADAFVTLLSYTFNW